MSFKGFWKWEWDSHKCKWIKVWCPYPVPCFIAGSQVITQKGMKSVEDVMVGDMILTRDNGFKEVAWTGRNISENGWVEFEDTKVSLQHRMLKIYDGLEYLVPAKKLAERGDGKIHRTPAEFVHFIFDSHEIVNVDGVWSESFFPGEYILTNKAIKEELEAIFPDLKERFTLAREEMRKLA